MARRSREHRQEIPGYDESRPSREERKQQHRATRHATHQMLHMMQDPDEVTALPEVKRTRQHETNNGYQPPQKRRFRVWKTKFWKRRSEYRARKAELDSNWPVITPEQLQQD